MGGKFGALALAALALAGCAVHEQGPVRVVAIDFSDRDFYDRGYAPSPVYAEVAPAPPADPPSCTCYVVTTTSAAEPPELEHPADDENDEGYGGAGAGHEDDGESAH